MIEENSGIEVWYPYNSFGYYHELPLAGKRATRFVKEKNLEKGGHWTLHTPAQYNEWRKKKGDHLKFLGLIK